MASASAAETPFVADELIYDSNTQEIFANGNVEINSENGYFYLDHLTYDVETEQITISGNVKGVLPSGERILSDYAFLDASTKALLLKNARIMLKSKLQIVASVLRDNAKETYGENVLATSCEICLIKKAPIWQIRASKIWRDKANEKIYFRNAKFEIAGIPVMNLPYFRIPDFGVKRMSGFLRPKIIFSDLFLSGIKLPYYQVINNHADLTLTPYVTTSNVYNIEGNYRHELKGGLLTLDGAYSFNDGEGETGRYFLQSKFNGMLSRNLHLDAVYTLNSDNDFAPNFNYANSKTNSVKLYSTDNHQNLEMDITHYRPTSVANEANDNVMILPNINYQKVTQIQPGTIWVNEFGMLGIDNEDAQDWLRFSNDSNLKHVFSLPFGVMTSVDAGVKSQFYVLESYDGNDASTSSRVSPYFSADNSLPLSKSDAYGRSLITPRVQLAWGQNYENGDIFPNRDSLFIEHDYVSLFSLNRFSGQDRQESGLRANIGASYFHQSNSGASLDFGFGRILRFTEDPVLNEMLGANSNDSEWVGYMGYAHPDGYSFHSRGAWDDENKLSRSEVGVGLTKELYNINLNGVYLEPEPEIGFADARKQLTTSGSYHFAPNWQVDFSFSHDLLNTAPLTSSFDLTYGNECVEATLGFIQDSNRGEGIETETRYEFTITMIGLGDTPKRDWPRRKCQHRTKIE